MHIERSFPSGAWQVSAFLRNGDWVTETFYGYTKREASAIFAERYGRTERY
jgi:hypothetical protein